jgi:hypothetical protein
MPPSDVLADVYRVLLGAAARAAREKETAECAGSAVKSEEA